MFFVVFIWFVEHTTDSCFFLLFHLPLSKNVQTTHLHIVCFCVFVYVQLQNIMFYCCVCKFWDTQQSLQKWSQKGPKMTPKVVLGPLREGPKATPKPTWDQNGNRTKKKHQKVENTPLSLLTPFLTKIDTCSQQSGHRCVIWVRYCPARVPNKVNEKNDVVRGLPACTRARVPIFRRVKKHTPKHFMLRPFLTFCSTCWREKMIFKQVIKKTSTNSGAGEPLKLMGPILGFP